MHTALFVYGTLKRGRRAHGLLGGQEFLGEARTVPGYRLYDSGSFPCLNADPGGTGQAQGELWRVDVLTLRRLDDFDVPAILPSKSPVGWPASTRARPPIR
jgi:gamma-glutamylcyclotransferase (GGCT)/AIG2-like uncharacterized protein YtfP